MDLAALKQRLTAEVDARADALIGASRAIHAHPELNYEEHFAHDRLTDLLDAEGLEPTRSAFDLATAFSAEAGSEGPTIAVLCEYDALPGIGHACGHNVIAAAGLGAGLAAAALATEAGGRVRILGSPAEEGGGGKVLMIRRGALDGVDAAMMIHPADRDLTRIDAIAVQQVVATYHGEAAHAAAAPERGRNALDAAVLGYQAVAALRQHIEPAERIHGVFTDGGDKPNIVPARAETYWFVRSPTVAGLEALKPRVLACLQAGADATGCTMTHEWDDRPYFDMRDNGAMLDAWSANCAELGRTVEVPVPGTGVVGSTDMGNVSYEVPSIHPMIAVAPTGTAIHTEAFAEHTASDAADRGVIDGAKAMAMTIADLWHNAALLDRAREEFVAGT
jgi:amidohydrolase